MKIAGVAAIGSAGLGTAGTTTVSGSSETTSFELSMIDADPDAGFNYPYFLHAPSVEVGGERPILVMVLTYLEPSDTLQDHIDKARDLIEGVWGALRERTGRPGARSSDSSLQE